MGNTSGKTNRAICYIDNDILIVKIIFENTTDFDNTKCVKIKFDIRFKQSKHDPQSHAIHIHEYGDLTNGCKSTGEHYNPTNDFHGSYSFPMSPRHAGDLINNFRLNENNIFIFRI